MSPPANRSPVVDVDDYVQDSARPAVSSVMRMSDSSSNMTPIRTYTFKKNNDPSHYQYVITDGSGEIVYYVYIVRATTEIVKMSDDSDKTCAKYEYTLHAVSSGSSGLILRVSKKWDLVITKEPTANDNTTEINKYGYTIDSEGNATRDAKPLVLKQKVSTDPTKPVINNNIILDQDGTLLNVDLDISYFSDQLLLTTGFNGEKVYWQAVIDANGNVQFVPVSSGEHNVVISQGVATIDGKTVPVYDYDYGHVTTEDGQIILVGPVFVDLTRYLIGVADESDTCCQEIDAIMSNINSSNLSGIGTLEDYAGLIQKINYYTNTVNSQKYELNIGEQVTILENYANSITNMTNIFGQLVTQVQNTTLIDSSAMCLRIKVALNNIYTGITQIKKFKIAISETNIFGISNCMLSMANKLTTINDKLDDLGTMIEYFAYGSTDTTVVNKFGLSQADKDEIKKAEALIDKYTTDLPANVDLMLKDPRLENLKTELSKFEAKKVKLENARLKLAHAIGSLGIGIRF